METTEQWSPGTHSPSSYVGLWPFKAFKRPIFLFELLGRMIFSLTGAAIFDDYPLSWISQDFKDFLPYQLSQK